MSGARWEQLQELYHEALSRLPAERGAFLRVATDDDELAREVEALLTANDDADALLHPRALESSIREMSAAAAPPALEHYEILSLIGSGGMGVVYLARDRRLDRRVAIKMLPPAFVHDRERLARFEREARTASTLNHPNIITIYEVGSSGSQAFIAAELVEGANLRQRMQAGKLDLAETLRISVQAAHAFEAAHQAGIVHRDIKPENLMVRPDGLVKVLDFGLAKVADEPLTALDGSTEAGAVVGTPRYMSPEQARGRALDGRSDVFSLAAVVYELAAGRPAFAGETHAEVFAELLEKDPPPLHDVAPGVSDELGAVLARAMSKAPRDRHPSMRHFAEELERVLSSVKTPSSRRAWRWRKRLSRRWARVSGGIAAAAVFGMAGANYLRETDAGTPAPHAVPFATFAGNKDYPALSPDGNRMAFSWDAGKGGSAAIYILGGTGEPVRVSPPDRDAFAPAWSPDGRQVAYIGWERLPGPAGEIIRHPVFVVPAAGGAERRAGNSPAGLSWSPDGTRLAVTTEEHDIASILLATGEQTQLTSPAPLADSFPEFSPDGRSIAFLRGSNGQSREVFVLPAGGGAPRQVTWMKRAITRVVWTPDGRELVFSAWGDLWRVPAQGGQPRKIHVGAVTADLPSISRQGGRLAFTERYSDQNIWRFRGPGFQGGASPAMLKAADCLLCSTREDHSPSISPDGAHIAFVSKRSGYEEIWRADREGGDLRQLTSVGGAATGTPRWSPDGRWIVYDSRPEGYSALFVIPAAGGTPRQVTTFDDGATRPNWSADGQWIYFKSNLRGQTHIFKRPVNGGDRIQVTLDGGQEGFETPDGKSLYYAKGGQGIWSKPVSGGEERPVPELRDAIPARSWGVLRHGIYFFAKDENYGRTVRFFSFAARRATSIGVMPTDVLALLPGLAVSPDGSYLLWAQADLEVSNIKRVDGFR